MDFRACIAIPISARLDPPHIDPEVVGSNGPMLEAYFDAKFSKDVKDQLVTMPVAWLSPAAKLAATWPLPGLSDYGAESQKDLKLQSLFESAFRSVESRDLPKISERLCVSACDELLDLSVREQDLRRLLAYDENSDLRGRLAKVLLRRGQIQQAAHEAATYLREEKHWYGILFEAPLATADLKEIAIQSPEGSENKDVNEIRSFVEKQDLAIRNYLKKIGGMRPSIYAAAPQRAEDRELERRRTYDRARDQSEVQTYLSGKKRYLSTRCQQLVSAISATSDPATRAALSAELEEMKAKLARIYR